MAEKVTSMRLNDEDLEQFKAFAKDNGLNQQQAFNSLIALAELEKAKDVLGDRANSINTFRDTINKLLNFYVNALEENTTTEQTIREELQKELSTKDNTISALYEQVQDLKANKINSDNTIKEIESNNKSLSAELQKANNDIIDKQKSIDVLTNNNINQLQQLEQYKDLKSINDKLVKELEQLKADNTNLINENKQINDKLNNTSDMITFYKENISKLNDDTELYKQQIQTIQADNKQQIQEFKNEFAKRLDSSIKENQAQLLKAKAEHEDKLDIELQKKDLEIQKLNNTIEQLKSKEPKPGATTNIKK
jgi:DNA repair exonuclease SbcCD ATPase subunit